ncbi:hypothetical protein MUP01_09970, partial [Candidatus Bathyarchaeota archaeon]|nr:hypothetical protein [Candidatus Bathyarchaeota archaeon]
RGTSQDVRTYLISESDYEDHYIRFIENHDELRAIEAFGREKSKAAAVIFSTLMGLRFFHDGQLEGRSIRIPLQLSHVQLEKDDQEIFDHYMKLLKLANDRILHDGEWILLDSRNVSNEDRTNDNLLSWAWKFGDSFKIIVVNYSGITSQGFIKMPTDFEDCSIVFFDELTGEKYVYRLDKILNEGLYIRLEPFQSHFFSVQKL